MVWRIRDRATFEALRRSGSASTTGPRHRDLRGHRRRPPCPGWPTPWESGWAARSSATGCDDASGRWWPRRRPPLAPGAYLVAAGPEAVGLPFEELKRTVAAAMTSASRGRGGHERRPRPRPSTPGLEHRAGAALAAAGRSGAVLLRIIGLYQGLRAGRPSPCRFWPDLLGLRRRGHRAPRRVAGDRWLAVRRIAAVPPLGRPRRRPGPGLRTRRPMIVHLMFASTLGNIFKPLYEAMAGIIAFFYSDHPQLRRRHRPADDRGDDRDRPADGEEHPVDDQDAAGRPRAQEDPAEVQGRPVTLNEEMMKLYKEHGVNPAGGCLPMLIQLPVFVVLYGVIRGLTNTVKVARPAPSPTALRLAQHPAVPRPRRQPRPDGGLRPGPGRQPVLPHVLAGTGPSPTPSSWPSPSGCNICKCGSSIAGIPGAARPIHRCK